MRKKFSRKTRIFLHVDLRAMCILISTSSIQLQKVVFFPHDVPAPSSLNKHTQPAIWMWSCKSKTRHTERSLLETSALPTPPWKGPVGMSFKKRQMTAYGRMEWDGCYWWLDVGKSLHVQSRLSYFAMKPVIGPNGVCVSVIREIICPAFLPICELMLLWTWQCFFPQPSSVQKDETGSGLVKAGLERACVSNRCVHSRPNIQI